MYLPCLQVSYNAGTLQCTLLKYRGRTVCFIQGRYRYQLLYLYVKVTGDHYLEGIFICGKNKNPKIFDNQRNKVQFTHVLFISPIFRHITWVLQTCASLHFLSTTLFDVFIFLLSRLWLFCVCRLLFVIWAFTFHIEVYLIFIILCLLKILNAGL